MSLDKLKEKSKARVDLSEIPPELKATLTEFEFREDNRGRECLYLTIVDEENREITQKYTDFHLDKLIEALEQGGVDHLKAIVGKKILWKSVNYSIGNPRLVPFIEEA